MRTIKIKYSFGMEDFNCKNDIIYLIRHLSKLLQFDFEERVAQVGLTASQARTLFFINRCRLANQEVHQKDIEVHFSLAKSTVNGLVSRLERNGFIVKKNLKNYSVLTMTESGIQTIEKIRQGRVDTVNKLFSCYSQEEQQRVLKNLNKMIDSFKGGIECD